MEIVIAAVVVALGLAVGLVVAAGILAKRAPGFAATTTAPPGRVKGQPAPAAAPDKRAAAEVARLDERLLAREEALENRAADVAKREQVVGKREAEIDDVRERTVRQLERSSGLSASQAKALLLKELEDQVRHESARRLRAIEEETKRTAERRVRTSSPS